MKGSIAAASAVFVASAAAAAHNAHGAFHLRRNPAPEVCTVYTTVYVHPSDIPVPVANSTVYVYPTPVDSTTSTPCPESETPTPEHPKESYPPAETYPPAQPPKETPVPSSQPPKEYPVPSSQPPQEYPPAKPSKEVYVPAPPAPSSEAPKPPKETPSVPAYTPSPPAEHKPSSTKPAEKPKPSKPAGGKPYDNSGRIITKGDKWAMTYTPYTADGQCRSPEQVKEDIKNIAELGFTTIRSYSTDCGVFENVVPECEKHGLKVIYGIFLEGGGAGGKGPGSEYANQQLQDIIDHAGKDSVAMIIVGNEALFNNYCTAEELASYIIYVKEKLVSAGFPEDIAITTTEPVGTWEEKGKALCSAIDVFAVQIHPYFTSKVKAEEAGSFAKQQLEQASKVCPEAASKGTYITEIGWPKSGNANGEAIPGVEQQKKAMKNILENVGKESVLFSYQDDHWKEAGAYGVEQSFGCADALAY